MFLISKCVGTRHRDGLQSSSNRWRDEAQKKASRCLCSYYYPWESLTVGCGYRDCEVNQVLVLYYLFIVADRGLDEVMRCP